jgi:predicted nucleic acid-binding protein
MTVFDKVFVDTAPMIYYLEKSELYFEYMLGFFTGCIKNKTQIVTSTITVEEYLVYPYKTRDVKLIDNFHGFLRYMNVDVISVDSKIAEEGAKIRADYKDFKAMDALQIATAICSGCDSFFTNDKQLRNEKYIPCITIDELKRH